MKEIVIIGSGGLAREVKWLLEEINNSGINNYKFLGYVVSDINRLTDNDSKEEILGDFSWFDERNDMINVGIGIGNPTHRIKVADQLLKSYSNILFPPIIHPNVSYDPNSCKIDRGVIICSTTILTVNVLIEEFSLLNLNCTVAHESIVGRGSVLNPGVNISGGVSIGQGVMIGTGSQIIQYLSIGDRSVVGAGSVVINDVPSKTTVFGVPARRIIKKES